MGQDESYPECDVANVEISGLFCNVRTQKTTNLQAMLVSSAVACQIDPAAVDSSVGKHGSFIPVSTAKVNPGSHSRNHIANPPFSLLPSLSLPLPLYALWVMSDRWWCLCAPSSPPFPVFALKTEQKAAAWSQLGQGTTSKSMFAQHRVTLSKVQSDLNGYVNYIPQHLSPVHLFLIVLFILWEFHTWVQ